MYYLEPTLFTIYGIVHSLKNGVKNTCLLTKEKGIALQVDNFII